MEVHFVIKCCTNLQSNRSQIGVNRLNSSESKNFSGDSLTCLLHSRHQLALHPTHAARATSFMQAFHPHKNLRS